MLFNKKLSYIHSKVQLLVFLFFRSKSSINVWQVAHQKWILHNK